MHPVLALRAFFLLCGAAILLLRAFPSLSARFLTYGSRGTIRPHPSVNASSHSRNGAPNLLDTLSSAKVPHSWFTSFYVTITALSGYWIFEILGHGPIFQTLAHAVTEHNPHETMTVHQVLLTWALMTIQGVRRLYESLLLSRPSNSQMWVGHWILGIAFYIGMSIAVWIEGSPALLNLQTPKLTDIRFVAPTFRTFVALPLFLLASGAQNDAHRYLASLRPSSPPSASAKPVYKIPEHPLFRSIVCPHYTAECVIYVALSVIAAPKGYWMNWTVASALFFVVSNLAATADGTKRWYERRFGEGSVRGKWRMIPYLF